MKTLIFISTLLIFASCQTQNSNKTTETRQASPCQDLKDSMKINILLSQADTVLPTNDFYDIVRFIETKDNMKLIIDKKIPTKIEYWKDIYLTHIVDTCNHKYLTQFYVLKNITATSCYFKSTKPLKGTRGYYPGFHFIQWNFANNSDRDSAYKIMNWVYNNDEIIMYDKRYNQTVIADHRLYMFEPGAKIFEETGIKFAEYLKDYLESPKNNSH